MARKRRTSEIVKMLKRRLLQSDRDTVTRVADDVREFAIANEFYCYRSVENILSMCSLAHAWDRSQVESAIRRQSQRKS